MSEILKGLATRLRNGGNPYGEYRILTFTTQEMKELADLLDPPPRFNEAQMALFKSWYDIGARSARLGHDSDLEDCLWFYSFGEPIQANYRMGYVRRALVIDGLNLEGKTLDLAELLEKDGAR